jgi:hypothetical protein
MVPPLAVDPRPIIEAKVARLRWAIRRAKTTTSIQATLDRAAADPTIGRRQKTELVRCGRERMRTLGDAMVVNRQRRGRVE